MGGGARGQLNFVFRHFIQEGLKLQGMYYLIFPDVKQVFLTSGLSARFIILP